MEGKSESINVLKTDIPSSSFATAHVGAVKIGLQSKRFLRQATRQANVPKPLSKKRSQFICVRFYHAPTVVGCDLKVHGLKVTLRHVGENARAFYWSGYQGERRLWPGSVAGVMAGVRPDNLDKLFFDARQAAGENAIGRVFLVSNSNSHATFHLFVIPKVRNHSGVERNR